MAFSYETYAGNGVNAVFNVPFTYIERSHVSAFVDGVKVSMGWLTTQTVKLSVVPEAGAQVRIRRFTPNTTPLVDFTDGATLTARDLDLMALQAVLMNQEAVDLSEELINELEEETDDDISAIRSALKNLNTRALEAVAMATSALNSALEGVETAQNAEAYIADTANGIATMVSEVSVKHLDASVAAELALAAAAETTAEQLRTLGHAANALLYRNEAQEAASTAVLAAGFDPADFYSRAQTDVLLNTSSFEMEQIVGLQSALSQAGGSEHTHDIADITMLQSTLDGKLSTSGTAAKATKLATARTIRLTGAVTGDTTFDGTAQASITTTAEISGINGLVAALADKMPVSRSFTSGNGLTGGGDGSTNRTISLGTPSAITVTSTNSVGTATHSHELSSTTVRTLIAQAGVGVTGTFGIFKSNAGSRTSFGEARLGSSLVNSTLSGTGNGVSPSGVWVACCEVPDGEAGLWFRTS